MKLKELLNVENLKQFEEINRPVILAGIGVVSFWVAIGMSWKAAPKAKEIIERRTAEFKDAEEGKEAGIIFGAVKEMAATIGPALAASALGTLAVAKSSSIAAERLAIATAAYSLVESRLKEVDGKLDEVGKLTSKDVREKISADKVKAADIPSGGDSLIIEHTGYGNVLCYDEYRGKPFYSSAEAIGQAINRASYRLQSEMWISLNDLYEELNLSTCPMGDDLGWNIDKVPCGQIPVHYTAVLTSDNRQCLSVQFDVQLRERQW